MQYEIVETSRCVSCGLNTSDRYTKEDCLTILRLMDDIRESWDMTFEGEEKKIEKVSFKAGFQRRDPRLFCIFQNYFWKTKGVMCVQYKAKKRSVKG